LEPRHQQLSTRRGGAMNSPTHVLQVVLATLLLVIAAVMFIIGYEIPGILLMIAGGVVAFLNFGGK